VQNECDIPLGPSDVRMMLATVRAASICDWGVFLEVDTKFCVDTHLNCLDTMSPCLLPLFSDNNERSAILEKPRSVQGLKYKTIAVHLICSIHGLWLLSHNASELLNAFSGRFPVAEFESHFPYKPLPSSSFTQHKPTKRPWNTK
jgi:hypothetical protein